MSEIGHNGIGLDDFPNNTCPMCGASRGNGHAEDCVARTRIPPPRKSDAEIVKGYLERIAYLEELNRRLEKYAAFEGDGFVGGGVGQRVSVECKNCGMCHLMTMQAYEQLQRETHERNSRIDL